ncbi:MAG TPA: S8 family serine peptidase [Planctomycetota bacterium]
MSTRTWHRRAVLALALTPLALATTSLPHSSQETPAEEPQVFLESPEMVDGEVPGLRFVELRSTPLADANVTRNRERTYRSMLQLERAAFRAEARERGLAFTEHHEYEVLFNGLAIEIADEDLAALEGLDTVTATYPVYRFLGGGVPMPASAPAGTTRENVTVTELTNVPAVHAAGIRGAGVTIGILDGGIDYNHPALGGPGFPNQKVIGGWDFADDDPDPFDDRGAFVEQHGTHVSGIAAGEDGVMVGVAPDAKIRFYRVFGTRNPGGTEDVILAAMERAADEGCDVVNMSLGSNRFGVLQQSLLPRAADRLLKRGVVPVIAAGNAGTAGPFLMGSPANSRSAIAVAAAYNTEIDELAFRLADGTLVPYRIMFPGPTPPSMGDYPIVDYGVANCSLPADVRYDGQIVLVQQGAFSCRSFTMVNLLADRGAAGVIWWQNTSNPTSWPGQFGSSTIPFRIPAVIVRRASVPAIQAQASAGPLTWGFYTQISTPLFPGVPTYFSSMGPSHELDFKPDVMAPGGYVFSTIPAHYGSYGIMDGTSMASPHVAGVVALMMSADPRLKGKRAHEVRERLMNTAFPMPHNTDPTLGLEPLARQGAGLVDVMAAVVVTAKTSPAKLALRDLGGVTRTETIVVENKASQPVTYHVTHVPALTAAPPMTGFWLPQTDAASVAFSHTTLVVSANSEASLTVSFQEPVGVPEGSVLGGWILLTPQEGGPCLRVPYMGLKGDYHQLPAINPTFTAINQSLDNPSLRPESRPNCGGPPPTRPACCSNPTPGSCGWSIGPSTPLTLDFTNGDKYDDAAFVMVSQGFPLLRKYRARVLDTSGRTVAWAVDRGGPLLDGLEYWVRNSGAGTGIDFAQWAGTLEDGSPAPAGIYYIRLEFDKFQGDGVNYPDFESWTTPAITVVR